MGPRLLFPACRQLLGGLPDPARFVAHYPNSCPTVSLICVQLAASSSSFPPGVPLLRGPGLGDWPLSCVFKASSSPDGLHNLDEGIVYYLIRFAAKGGCLLDAVLREAIPNNKGRAAAVTRCAGRPLGRGVGGAVGMR